MLYKRNDTATIEVDTLEFSRLVLEGKNIRFEELPCKDQELSFEILQSNLKEKIQIETFNKDTLKTLNLYDDVNGFNNAAGLLADKNHFPGIDIVKFGDNVNQIMDRNTIKNKSIFDMFDGAYEMYKKYYEYEEINGITRKIINIVPENAFREALANALIHRTWDDTPNVRISMYKDKIEITSPGGLIHSVSKEEYLNGQVSKPRNPIIANVFFRLKYIEMFGTGILRIKQIYQMK